MELEASAIKELLSSYEFQVKQFDDQLQTVKAENQQLAEKENYLQEKCVSLSEQVSIHKNEKDEYAQREN